MPFVVSAENTPLPRCRADCIEQYIGAASSDLDTKEYLADAVWWVWSLSFASVKARVCFVQRRIRFDYPLLPRSGRRLVVYGRCDRLSEGQAWSVGSACAFRGWLGARRVLGVAAWTCSSTWPTSA